MTVLLPVALIGYVVLAVVFVVVAWKSPPRAKWLGLAAITTAAPFFVWLGSFAEQFGAGLCYSSTVALIAKSVERTKSPVELGQAIRSLPMHGYETNCAKVEAAAKELPHTNAP